jgi:cell division protein FtsL
MSGLEQAFYVMSIVYMSIMLILVACLVVAVFVIRSKVNHIQQQIEEKINSVTNIAEKSGELAAAAVGAATRRAKKAIKR